MKLNLDKMDTYKFVVCVLVFILIFAFICSSQMKFTVNKILESQTKYKVTEPVRTTSTYTPSNYTQATQDEVDKYQNYGYK